MFWNRLFGTYWWATWTMLVCNGFVPMMLWFKRVRHSIPALFVISIFINIGMWFERYVIVVTSLHARVRAVRVGHLQAVGHR